jgi:hypothetical protein
MKRLFCFKTVIGLALAFTMFMGASLTSAEPWKFGVMADTQWKANLDGQNPGTVAVGIINQLNPEFISHGVKFVIQVGDLVDVENDALNNNPALRTMPIRAAAAQGLYDAGIGFYPLRGNHEGSQTASLEFQTLYPETQGNGPNVVGATNLSSPVFMGDPTPAKLNGLTYSFDYKNARFVLLDQFTRTDGTNYLNSSNNNILDQLPWMMATLEGTPADSHSFVFSHKNLIGQNHTNILFGANPSQNPLYQDWFIGVLQKNGVRYHFSGHDHMHHRSIIKSPGGYSEVQEVMCSSNSYKFYTPQDPSNDEKYNLPAPPTGFGFLRETPITQELYTVGYYIVTVDGPRVTVDHYSSPNGCSGDCDLTATPALTFSKRETFGYSLNGQEFLVPQGEFYNVVQDSFKGTTAMILGGTNGSTGKVYDGRALTKAVNTGWTTKEEADEWSRQRHGMGSFRRNADDLASHVLTLWGMADLGSDQTDIYTLSMTYNHKEFLGKGGFGLATRDEDGKWINAVDLNNGGTKKFVVGPWNPAYALGTYGVDPSTHTAWAVVNYNGDFACSRF